MGATDPMTDPANGPLPMRTGVKDFHLTGQIIMSARILEDGLASKEAAGVLGKQIGDAIGQSLKRHMAEFHGRLKRTAIGIDGKAEIHIHTFISLVSKDTEHGCGPYRI